MRAKNDEMKNKVYAFIVDYIQKNRVSPTVREIASGVNCAVSGAYKFMVRLQEEGLINIAGRRHIVLSMNNWAMSYAPILGMVACGKPQPAIQDIRLSSRQYGVFRLRRIFRFGGGRRIHDKRRHRAGRFGTCPQAKHL